MQLPKATGPLEFSGAGDQLLQFIVTPPAGVPAGAYTLHPTARIGDEVFSTSLAPIPTLPTRDWSEPADAKVHVLNLIVPAGLRVGYIAADNDPLPEILRQLGIRVDMLDDVALAFGDLSQYDAITVGIRAYELRPDLLRANSRLLNYVKRGGTLLVQYQRDFAWNSELPAPFKATMPEQTSRVTDANSPVTFLAPDSPLLNSPNKITQADFQGWVQERGLYFWGTFDSKYTPVLGLNRSRRTGNQRLAGLRQRWPRPLHLHRPLLFPRTPGRRPRRLSPVRQPAEPDQTCHLAKLNAAPPRFLSGEARLACLPTRIAHAARESSLTRLPAIPSTNPAKSEVRLDLGVRQLAAACCDASLSAITAGRASASQRVIVPSTAIAIRVRRGAACCARLR